MLEPKPFEIQVKYLQMLKELTSKHYSFAYLHILRLFLCDLYISKVKSITGGYYSRKYS